jgi:hypothetical protein
VDGPKIEVWAFCDDPECQQDHEEDEFGNDRHQLPPDHPAVLRATEMYEAESPEG